MFNLTLISGFGLPGRASTFSYLFKLSWPGVDWAYWVAPKRSGRLSVQAVYPPSPAALGLGRVADTRPATRWLPSLIFRTLTEPTYDFSAAASLYP